MFLKVSVLYVMESFVLYVMEGFKVIDVKKLVSPMVCVCVVKYLSKHSRKN